MNMLSLVSLMIIVNIENGWAADLHSSDGSDSVTTSSPEDIIPIHHEASTISPVKDIVDGYLRQGYAPQEIAVILDVDGTLTMHADPNLGKSNVPTQAKGNSVEIVKDLENLGVIIIFSSAWNIFQETIMKLTDLGLMDAGDRKFDENDLEKGFDSMLVKYRYKNAVSVRYSGNNGYFKNKYYSLSEYNQELAKKVKVIVFADDSSDNIKKFIAEHEELSPYSSLEHVDVVLINNMK